MQLQALGLYNFVRGLGWTYKRGGGGGGGGGEWMLSVAFAPPRLLSFSPEEE